MNKNGYETDKANKNKSINDLISNVYSPTGNTEDKNYKTSLELIYDLGNVLDIDTGTLARELITLGYKTEYIGGQPYWVVYEKKL